jgi:O-antigen/teichoic acid export membrane protein
VIESESFRRLTSTDGLRTELRSRSVRAAALTWSAGAADFALRLASTAVLARLIVPEHFGLVMMIMAVTAIADQFRDLGLSTVTVQRETITEHEVSNLFWINVLAGVAITLVICLGSPLIASYYHEPRLVLPTCILATNFTWGGLMVQHQALLTRQLRLGRTSLVRFFSGVVSTVLALLLAWWGFGYWALVWREVTRCALLTIGMWFSCPWVPEFPHRRTNVFGLVRFGADLSLANIVGSVTAGTDRFLLGRLWGAEPMAMYRQAYQLLVMATEQLLSPVYQVTQPGLSILQTDAVRFRMFYQKVLTITCLATMPLSAFVFVYSTEITRILLGPKWSAAASLLAILSVSTFIKQPIGSTAFVLIAQGRSASYLRLTVLQNGATVVFMCIGVYWGPVGIALSEVAATYLIAGPRLVATFKGSPFTICNFITTIVPPVIASIAMVLVTGWLHESLASYSPSLQILIGALAGGLVFFSTWSVLPGGAGTLLGLVMDVRSAVGGRINIRARTLATARAR